MNKKGQLQFIRNAAFFVFIIIGVIVISMLAVVTTPLINGLTSDFGLTGGMAVFVNHFNFIMLVILLLSALILSHQGGQT